MKDKLDFMKGKLADVKLSKNNKRDIKKFNEMIKHLSPKRIEKYNYAIIRFAELIEKDFEKLTSQDTLKLNPIIAKSELSKKTLKDIVGEIKYFYKMVYGKGIAVPVKIALLKAPKGKGVLSLPEEIPDEAMIYRMIKACNNWRDKFWIALVGLDGALRVIEERNIKLGDIKKDRYGYFITIKTAKDSGDKDTRTVRIIKSEPYFIKWLEHYPAEKTDDSYLFINLADLQQVQHSTITALFRRLKKKLKVKKLNPYILRHACLTRMSKDASIPISVLKKFAGHSLSSNIIGEYQHFGDDDLKDMQLKHNGIIKDKSEKKLERKPITCPKCKKSNEYDAEFCFNCNMALSQKRQVQSNERLDRLEKMFKELLETSQGKYANSEDEQNKELLKAKFV